MTDSGEPSANKQEPSAHKQEPSIQNPEPAATVILLRNTPAGLEVLLLLRAKAVKFAGGAWVFPGGRIDDDDTDAGVTASSLDKGDDAFNRAARRAALRECLEETGIQLDADNLVTYSHWTTPATQYNRRFSTRFLLAELTENQPVTVDDGEIVEFRWLTPAQALTEHDNGELVVLPPTYRTLTELNRCQSADEAITMAKQREMPDISPLMVKHDGTVTTLYKEDISYTTGDLSLQGPQHRMTRQGKRWIYVDTTN
ncbi:NUDIX hydrolase [Pseudomaricurvus alkylphenolicus]|uniref:NUDIX hydrolase n=1 Tax=Pseudomaricurvus alkylphenolicus TaxID=1306991 RepID=UPI00141FC57A|nr:NUDIX hydrolase [Pseudomaricurvus alkylphenolicus]NIB43728.1 NUDIX hydrolase [Pseudomaricurvus alkylphenolicus]